LEDPFKGRYIHLEHASRTELDQLKQNNLLFEKGDRFQDAAGINLDFPRHRGVFCSADTRFIVWINEEDHMRIISLEKSSDLSSVYNRLSQGVALVNQTLEFAWNHTYGYLTACPTNIGTAMRAGVHIRLEKLARQKERLSALVEAYQLQIRGTSGEKTMVENAVFDISNRQRLGISEAMIVRNLHKGLSAIIAAEKSL
jgi:creatine kinase/arginine kinase